MDNKNEKTFADLFSSSNLEIDKEENEQTANEEKGTTFDSLANGIFTDKFENNNSISFGDIKEVLDDNQMNNNNSSDNLSFFDNEKEQIQQDLSIQSQENVNLENSVVNRENNNLFFEANDSDEELKNEKVKNDNPFFDNVENENEFKEQKLPKEEVNVKSENLEVADADSAGNNIFLQENVDEKKDAVDLDIKKERIDDSSALESENDVKEDNNLFLEGNVFDTKSEDGQNNINQNDNPFFNNDEVEQNNGAESINQLVEENAIKKAEAEKEKVNAESASVSPFFQDLGDDVKKMGEAKILNNISFDETKQINSKLDKLDLSGTKNFNVKLVKKKMSLLRFITGVISYAFFIFLVLILVTLLAYVLDIKIRAAKGDYSAPTFNAYVVLTGSMLPEIQVKDVVITKKVNTNDLKVGDIITFASSDSRFLGTIITHRIIKKNQDKDGNVTFQTQGDNNNVADSALVQPNNIYGKVILKIPKLGYLQDFLATQGGWIIVILLPCVTVISYDIVKLSKGLKRRKNKINVIK